MTFDRWNKVTNYDDTRMKDVKKVRKEEEKPLLKLIEIQNLKMKIIENYERKQWTIDYSPYKLKIIPPRNISFSIYGLSDEIIHSIYSYLDIADVLEMLCVSKELSKFSIHYLYEHPVITSLTSLSQFLPQFYRVREVKPLTLPIIIQSLTFTQSFYNDVIQQLNGESHYLPQLHHQLQELFHLSFSHLHTLSFNFQMDHPGFTQFFLPILQDTTFSSLKVLRLKNPSKGVLTYLLLRTPQIQYLCQDTYTNTFYVDAKELLSLNRTCEGHLRKIYYTLGKPIESNLNHLLKHQNLGIWRIVINNEFKSNLE